MSRSGDIRENSCPCECRRRQRLDRLMPNLHHGPDPGEIDGHSCLCDGARVEVDRDDPTPPESNPGLRKKSGSTPHVDGVTRREMIERRETHDRGGVIPGAEPTARCLQKFPQ